MYDLLAGVGAGRKEVNYSYLVLVRKGDKMFTELDTVWSSWEMGVVLRFITLWFPIGIPFKYIYLIFKSSFRLTAKLQEV